MVQEAYSRVCALLKHVPRHMFRHVPDRKLLGHITGHVPRDVIKIVPDRHVLGNVLGHEPRHVLRHMLWHMLRHMPHGQIWSSQPMFLRFFWNHH